MRRKAGAALTTIPRRILAPNGDGLSAGEEITRQARLTSAEECPSRLQGARPWDAKSGGVSRATVDPLRSSRWPAYYWRLPCAGHLVSIRCHACAISAPARLKTW